MFKMGLMSINVPGEFGGAEMSALAYAVSSQGSLHKPSLRFLFFFVVELKMVSMPFFSRNQKSIETRNQEKPWFLYRPLFQARKFREGAHPAGQL